MANTNKIPVGLKIPLARGTAGYFDQNFTTLSQASTNIKNLLSTDVGERRMNVGFGSTLNQIVFDQMDTKAMQQTALIAQIQNLINAYFPYVDIIQLNVVFPQNEPNRINVDITFQLKNSSDIMFGASQQTVSVTLNTTN